jgi:NADPH:quinone reductase-like Zn-dependent oxidoreductase
MRAVVLVRHGGYDALQVRERPAHACGPGHVRIAVHAAGVNFADTMARVGLYPDAQPLPSVLGYEVAGEVVERAAGVRDVDVGDRVIAATRFGGYAEEVVVGAHDTLPLPAAMSFAEGAAVPVNYSTAWTALVDAAGLRPGERVLVHAAAGGVGIAATQIARAEGAEVWGTASPGKHDQIRAQGVEHAIDYTRRGWDHALPPFDVVLDPIGGASFRRSYRLLRPGGRLVAYGAQATMRGERRDLRRAVPAVLAMMRGFDLVRQMRDSKTVIGLNMLRLWDDRGTLEPWIAPLREGLARGTLRPVVAATVPFSRAGDAHRMLLERRNVGKVVLVPDERMG